MKKCLTLAYFIGSLAFSTTALAQDDDHLEPNEGIFESYDFNYEYHSRLRKILLGNLSDLPETRLVIIPSFDPESVLSIESMGRNIGPYYILCRVMNTNLWYARQGDEKLFAKEYKKEISDSVVHIFRDLFLAAVFTTRYTKKSRYGTDGTMYYFSVNDNGIKAGQMWSPYDSTRFGRLVKLCDEIVQELKEDTTFNLSTKRKIEIESLIHAFKQ